MERNTQYIHSSISENNSKIQNPATILSQSWNPHAIGVRWAGVYRTRRGDGVIVKYKNNPIYSCLISPEAEKKAFSMAGQSSPGQWHSFILKVSFFFILLERNRGGGSKVVVVGCSTEFGNEIPCFGETSCQILKEPGHSRVVHHTVQPTRTATG